MGYSVGNAIRDINKNGIKPSYFLLGDDFFMQNFFINKIKENLIKDSMLNSKYFYLNEENDLNNFFNDITSLSLFSSKDLFIIKNFNKMSKEYQSTLINYLQKVSIDNTIIFVLNDFMIKNKFVKEISEKSVVIDTRTPINKSKIMDWVKYYYNNEGISINDNLLKYFVNNYSDDISTVVNEIEKRFLFNNDKHIDFNLNENNIYFSKHIKAWNLLDALGKKDISKSISYYNNLYINGTSLVFLLINLNNFYFELYNTLCNQKNNYNSLNKILQSNLNLYKRNYSKNEIVKIFLLLRDLDVKIKTSTFNELTVFSSIIIKICNGYYD